MSIIAIILILAVFGFLCWLILQIPMPSPIPQIIVGIVIILMILWVLGQLGVATPFHVRLW